MRFTIHTLGLCLLFIFTHSVLSAQDEKYPFSKWDEATLAAAKTYDADDKTSDLEKQVIYYTNLVRLNPKLFAQTYAKKYIDDNAIKCPESNSLLRELNKVQKLEVLDYNASLYNCARAHAESNGKKGLEGHQNYNSRFKKYAPQYTTNGENCDYGRDEGLAVVMSLLIDQDVPGLGHRKNILSKSFRYVGVAYAPHKQYAHNVVMCFGG